MTTLSLSCYIRLRFMPNNSLKEDFYAMHCNLLTVSLKVKLGWVDGQLKNTSAFDFRCPGLPA